MDFLQKVVRPLFLAFCLVATIRAFGAERRASVHGFGLFGNAELRSSLNLLEIEKGELDSQKMDDGAFLLTSRLKQNGYLDASVSATISLTDGREMDVSWPQDYEPQLIGSITAKAIDYTVNPGLLYYYKEVTINGDIPFSPNEARAYFIPNTTLYSRKKDKAYSPSIFANQQKQIIYALQAQGYQDAKVVDTKIDLNDRTGSVIASVTIEKGPRFQVREEQVTTYEDGERQGSDKNDVSAIYNRTWIEDRTRELRNESYHLGFPDTKISSKVIRDNADNGVVTVTVQFDVRRGRKYFIGETRHIGATDTHQPLLERKTRLESGSLLDITEVEAARRRLSSIGVFNSVELEFEPDGENVRDVTFNYHNGQRVEWQLLLGYGSYEQFRFGVIGQRSNLFGRAHSLTFEAIQSLKSTSGKLDYTVPEIFGESINGNFEASYLNRKEVSFDRKERGVSLGLSTRLERYHLDLGLDYAFDRKESSDPAFAEELRLKDTNIGSVLFRATQSTLNDLLYPTSGYEIFIATRYAAKELGGEAEYTRPEAGASFHKKLGSRWLAHLGLKGGLLTGPGESKVEIPNTERFLVGGENSLRGFQRGEAGPVDDSGVPIGAEAYGLINAELEYPLFDKLSAVVFVDAARVWASTESFGIYDDLADVGLGLRYRTIIGPVRLEYGRNIDPRRTDPAGTLHLSIGFPF